MSDVMFFGEQTWTERRWIGVEHGDRHITVNVREGTNNILIALSSDDAQALARDLFRRAMEIEGRESKAIRQGGKK